MGIKITQMPNMSKLKQEFRDELLKEMERVAIDNKEEIITRTGKGVDYKDQQFAPYTPKYSERKKEKGRTTSKPDLRFSGRMLQSLQTGVFQSGSKVIARVFTSSSAEALKIQGNMRKREFFAISEKAIKDFRDRLGNLFGRLKS